MPTKRNVLAFFSRDELLAVVDQFDITATDRRAKGALIDSIAGSKKATLAGILPTFPRARLKELCQSLGLEDGGREKAALVDRIAGTKPRAEEPAPAPTKTAQKKRT